jgi:hypothetical protein
LATDDAEVGIQFIKVATSSAFTLGSFEKMWISGKLRPAYNAKQRISRILRTTLGAFKMRSEGLPTFFAEF